ncbi:MAG: hypothetical protein JWO36_2943 [Myxococcales bacterium]|nr:hypothetical protein [Myxococcales bacterium]
MSNAYAPLVEAFLIVDQPRQRLSHWTQTLAALDSQHAPALAAIIAFYDPTTDQALLNLRYDELAIGPKQLEFIVEIALLAEVGMIQPHQLSEAERKRFLMERLTRCTHQVTYQRSVVGALTEVVRKVKETKSMGTLATTATPLPRQPPPIPKIARKPSPRGDTDDPVLLVPAKGTRNDLDTIEPEPLGDPRAGIRAKSTRDDLNLALGSGARPPVPPPLPRAARRDDSTYATPQSPMHKAQMPTAEMPLAPQPRPPTFNEVSAIDLPTERRGSSPNPDPLANAIAAQAPGLIYAKYLRSGKWVASRVGALSLKGAALMTGAMPRLHDHVDIALTFGGHRALVRGAVAKVSSHGEARTTGASSFSVNFELDEASRQQLTTLLTAARAAKITIKPPPPRSTRRYPVEWPLCLGTTRGALKADALDVSTHGMFVRPANSLTLDAVVNFSVVLDDNAPPIAGRARVVRHISEAEAKTAGLAAGYGLNITEIADADRMRWFGFLARIERRAELRVLIGASPARLVELQSALAAVGYAVTGGTDPGALVQLATAETRPVDAALIDGGWIDQGGPWVETLFSSRNVPCVTLFGDARRARTALDKLLAVAV